MKTIALVCEKGGTGKTTLARELYEGSRRKGYKTSLYMLDGQYEDGNIIDPEAEIAIADTAGILSSNIKDVIKGSDLIIIPTRPTPNDAEPFLRTIDLIEQITDAPVLVVVNGFNRYKMATEYYKWLEEKKLSKHLVTIPQSEQIVKAQPNESAITYGKKTTAGIAVQHFVDTVFDLINS